MPIRVESNGLKAAFLLAVVYIGFVGFLVALGMLPEENSLHWGFQLADANWLQKDWLRTLWYDHSQPPLYNALHGILIHLAPKNYVLLGISIQLVLLWASSVVLWYTLKTLQSPRWLGWVAPVAWLCSPGLHLFHWLYFYEALSLMLVQLMALGAALFFTGSKQSSAYLFLGSLVLLSLTRSWAHPLLPLAVGVYLLYISKPILRFRVSVLLLVFVAWLPILKNGILFNQWTTSSWGGMSLARVAFTYPKDLQPSMGETKLSNIKPFLEWSHYPLNIQAPNPSIPFHPSIASPYRASGYPNFRFTGYIALSRSYHEASITAIRSNPKIYLQHVGLGMLKFFYPVHAVDYFETNVSVMEPLLLVTDALGGQWNALRGIFGYAPVQHPLAKVCFLWLLIVLAILYQSVRLAMQRRAEPILLFCLFWLLYVWGVSSIIEYGENMRFRMMVMPLMPIFLLTTKIFSREA